MYISGSFFIHTVLWSIRADALKQVVRKGLSDAFVLATMRALLMEHQRGFFMADNFELRKFVAPEFVFGEVVYEESL